MNNNLAKCILEESRDEYFNQALFIELHVHVVIEDLLSRDVITHNTEDCGSRVLMIERSQR
jgi:hypothetical protein